MDTEYIQNELLKIVKKINDYNLYFDEYGYNEEETLKIINEYKKMQEELKNYQKILDNEK